RLRLGPQDPRQTQSQGPQGADLEHLPAREHRAIKISTSSSIAHRHRLQAGSIVPRKVQSFINNRPNRRKDLRSTRPRGDFARTSGFAASAGRRYNNVKPWLVAFRRPAREAPNRAPTVREGSKRNHSRSLTVAAR